MIYTYECGVFIKDGLDNGIFWGLDNIKIKSYKK